MIHILNTVIFSLIVGGCYLFLIGDHSVRLLGLFLLMIGTVASLMFWWDESGKTLGSNYWVIRYETKMGLLPISTIQFGLTLISIVAMIHPKSPFLISAHPIVANVFLWGSISSFTHWFFGIIILRK